MIDIKLNGDLWVLPKEIAVNTAGCDFNLFNLETPIIENKELTKRKKAGPHIHGLIDDFQNLYNTLPNPIFSLANNHIMDFGDNGLETTISACQNFSYKYLGAGNDITSAKTPIILNQNGIKIGILARCETQFGIASPWKSGVAFLDYTLYHSIQSLKSKCDFVIISIHGSAEMSPWPSPKWQDYLRSLIDTGADIIYGHHSHVPQGYENYKDRFIFYGLGNFLVDPGEWNHYSNTLWSITPIIKFDQAKLSCLIKTTVIEEINQKITVRESDEQEYEKHLFYLESCNAPLYNRQQLEGLWQEFSIRMYNSCYSQWLGFNRKQKNDQISLQKIIRSKIRNLKETIFNSNNPIESNHPTTNQLMLWYHLFACESHNDAISTALGVLSGEVDDLRTNDISLMIDEMIK